MEYVISFIVKLIVFPISRFSRVSERATQTPYISYHLVKY